MKYKVIKNEKGEVLGISVDEKGFPIVIQEKDGVENEIGLDAIHLYGKVPGLMAEAKGHRLAAEEANKVINLFKEREVGDIPTFLEKGLAALETVGNLEEGKLVDAKKIEEIKLQAQENIKLKLDEKEKAYLEGTKKSNDLLKKANAHIYDLMVRDKIQTSTFVKAKWNGTTESAYRYWRDQIKVEPHDTLDKLQVVSYYVNGEKVMSQEKIGEPADLDEALALLVSKDADADSLLRGSAAEGSGKSVIDFKSKSGGLSREQYNKLSTFEKLGRAHQSAEK